MSKQKMPGKASAISFFAIYTVFTVILAGVCGFLLPNSVHAGDEKYVSSAVIAEIESKRLDSMPWFNKNCKGFIKNKNTDGVYSGFFVAGDVRPASVDEVLGNVSDKIDKRNIKIDKRNIEKNVFTGRKAIKCSDGVTVRACDTASNTKKKLGSSQKNSTVSKNIPEQSAWIVEGEVPEMFVGKSVVPDDVREASIALNTGGAGLNLYIPGDSKPDLVSEVLDALSEKIYYSPYKKSNGKSAANRSKSIKIFDSITVGGYSIDLKDITISDIKKKDSFLYEKRQDESPWIVEGQIPDIFEEKKKNKERALSLDDVPIQVPTKAEIVTPAEKGYLIIKGDTESFMAGEKNNDYDSYRDYMEKKKMLLVETILSGGVPENIGDFSRHKLTYICKSGLPVFFLNRNIGFLPSGGVEIHAFRPQIGIEIKYNSVKDYYRFYGKPFISVLPVSEVDTGIIILDGA